MQDLRSKDKIKGISRQLNLFGIKRKMLCFGSRPARSHPPQVTWKVRVYDMIESCLTKDLFVLRATTNNQHVLIEGYMACLDLGGQYAKELRPRPRCHA